jgi:hypothetical protein
VPHFRNRKKLIVVEAFQFRESFDGSLPLADFCGPSLARVGEDGNLAVRTFEGDMRIGDGDWIVKGVEGEFCPIRDPIFREAYEPADALL